MEYFSPRSWIHFVCLKANRKLAVIRKVKILNRKTLDILYKVTVRSVIDYALPVYCHSLKVSEKAKLDKIQYAAKIVTGVYKQAIRLKFFLRAGLGRNKDQGQLFRIIHISFKRMGLICFFLCPSDRNHKIQLLMITLYI